MIIYYVGIATIWMQGALVSKYTIAKRFEKFNLFLSTVEMCQICHSIARNIHMHWMYMQRCIISMLLRYIFCS